MVKGGRPVPNFHYSQSDFANDANEASKRRGNHNNNRNGAGNFAFIRWNAYTGTNEQAHPSAPYARQKSQSKSQTLFAKWYVLLNAYRCTTAQC